MQKERTARRAYGSGSIIERNGNYYGKWWIGRGPDAKQVKRKLGPIRTREREGLRRPEAEAKLRKLMAAVTAADVAPETASDGRTIATLGALYIEHRRDVKGIKASTLEQYEAGLRVHLVPFFRSTPVARIDAQIVERFTTHMHAK